MKRPSLLPSSPRALVRPASGSGGSPCPILLPSFSFLGVTLQQTFGTFNSDSRLLPGEPGCHSLLAVTTCSAHRHLRSVTSKFHSSPALPVSAWPTFQALGLRVTDMPTSPCSWIPLPPCAPSPLTPKSWRCHLQMTDTPPSLSFLMGPGRRRRSTLLPWTPPGWEAGSETGRQPSHC